MQLCLMCTITIACITDLLYRKIYDYCTYPLIISGFVYQIINHNWLIIILSILFMILYIFRPFFLKHKLMGGGDKKLLLGIMLYMGFFNVLQVIIIAHLLTVISYLIKDYSLLKNILIYKIKDPKYRLKMEIPMGPSYTLATVIVMFGYSFLLYL